MQTISLSRQIAVWFLVGICSLMDVPTGVSFQREKTDSIFFFRLAKAISLLPPSDSCPTLYSNQRPWLSVGESLWRVGEKLFFSPISSCSGFYDQVFPYSRWPMMNSYESPESLTSSLHRWVAISRHIKGAKSRQRPLGVKQEKIICLCLYAKLWTRANGWSFRPLLCLCIHLGFVNEGADLRLTFSSGISVD